MNKVETKKGVISLKELKTDLAKNSKETGTTIFHTTKNWLNENYDIRLNKISNEIESKKKDADSWSLLNDNDLYVEANENNINISQGKLLAILRSSFIEGYNPIKQYFDSLPVWDGKTDHITRYCSYLELAKDQNEHEFLKQFKKWLVRTVKCSLNEGYFNKQAIVLSDRMKGQNIGKSSWLRSLNPNSLSDYYTENFTGNDKDDQIQLARNFIINLDEMDEIPRKNIGQIKSMLSKSSINVRFPYAKTSTVCDRVASFVGSSNEISFLFDQTGSVRFICFVIQSIDFSYREKENVNLLWSQAFALSKMKDFQFEMTKKELKENERRNSEFYSSSIEEEQIQKYYAIPTNDPDELVRTLSASEVLSELRNYDPLLNLRAGSSKMGKYLTRLGFEDTKIKGLKKYRLKVI